MAFNCGIYSIKLRPILVLGTGILIFSAGALVHTSRNPPNKYDENEEPNLLRLERLRGPLEAADPTVLQILREKYLNPPNIKPYHLAELEDQRMYKEFRSWKFNHAALQLLFGKQTLGGFFVEAGALDGEFLSNTLYLEKELGWEGLLIEANPFSYKALMTKNRKAWSSNTCLAVTSFPQEMVLELTDVREMDEPYEAFWAIRGSSFLSPGKKNSKRMADQFDHTYTVVQCFPFTSYMQVLNITKVDVFSLDVEGAEEGVLATIPWSSIDISVVMVEHHGQHPYEDEAFVQSFVKHGYHLFDFISDKDNIGDYVFVKNTFGGSSPTRNRKKENDRKVLK